MISNNHKLEQDLHPTTTGDNSHSANLPGEELTEQDLNAVSGGVAVLSLTDEITDSVRPEGDPVPPLEKFNGSLGDMFELGEAANNLF